jgi:hypothetical protein
MFLLKCELHAGAKSNNWESYAFNADKAAFLFFYFFCAIKNCFFKTSYLQLYIVVRREIHSPMKGKKTQFTFNYLWFTWLFRIPYAQPFELQNSIPLCDWKYIKGKVMRLSMGEWRSNIQIFWKKNLKKQFKWLIKLKLIWNI